MAPRNIFFCFLTFLALSSQTAVAQDSGCLRRTLPLTVFNARGGLMIGLQPSDLEGKLDGRSVKIVSVRPDDRPHRIVVLLDTSGAVLGQPDAEAWVTANSIASHIARSTLQNTQLALLLFSDKVNETIGFSQGAPAATKHLAEIRDNVDYAKEYLHGKSALRDAILSALPLLSEPRFSDSIYMIGDGADNQSRNGARAVREALVAKGVRLYVAMLSFGSVAGMSDWDRRSEESDPLELADVANASGGMVFGRLGAGPFRKTLYKVKGQDKETPNLLADMYLGMTRNDLMEIELREPLDGWKKWSLDLASFRKNEHKDWILSYPRELAPCSAVSKTNSAKAN